MLPVLVASPSRPSLVIKSVYRRLGRRPENPASPHRLRKLGMLSGAYLVGASLFFTMSLYLYLFKSDRPRGEGGARGRFPKRNRFEK